MTKREAERLGRQENSLLSLGFTREEAEQLRRISMTLHRWYERECGSDHACLVRGHLKNGEFKPRDLRLLGEGATEMRIEPVKEPPYFAAKCCKCCQPIKGQKYADLDGEAFKAYYCEECRPVKVGERKSYEKKHDSPTHELDARNGVGGGYADQTAQVDGTAAGRAVCGVEHAVCVQSDGDGHDCRGEGVVEGGRDGGRTCQRIGCALTEP